MIRSHETYPGNPEKIPYGLLYDAVVSRFNEAVRLTNESSTHQFWLDGFRYTIGVNFQRQFYAIINFVDDVEKLIKMEGDALRFDIWLPLVGYGSFDTNLPPTPLPLDHRDSHLYIHGIPSNMIDGEPVVKITPDGPSIVSGNKKDIALLGFSRDDVIEEMESDETLDNPESTNGLTEVLGADTHEEFYQDSRQDTRRFEWIMGVVTRVAMCDLIERQKSRPFKAGPPDIESIA